MTQFLIRSAESHDIEQCIVIRGQTRENAISAARLAELGITNDSWTKSLLSGEVLGVVAHCNGQMAGYCFGSVSSGEIVVLALLPGYEQQGLGKALLQRVMLDLSAQGHHRLFLSCAADPQVRSFGFYRHLGWRSTGQLDEHGDELLEYIL